MKHKKTYPSISRLEILARHLESGQLFEQPKPGLVYSGEQWLAENLVVHINGQMIYYFRFPFRECVYLFPQQWEFQNDVAVLSSLKKPTTVDSCKKYFAIDTKIFQHFFCPTIQDTKTYGGKTIEFHDGECLPQLRKLIAHNIYCYLQKVCST